MLDLLISIILGTWAASKLPPHLPEPVFRVKLERDKEKDKEVEDESPEA